MDLLQSILDSQGGQTVDQLGQHVGLDRDQTVAAIESLLPALAGGMAKNATQPGGLESLMSALANGGHERYLENPSTLAHPDSVQDGNDILGHLLGSKDVSRQVAAQASSQTGIGPEVLKAMLPMVASLAMGALSSRARQQPSFGTASMGSTGGGGLLDMIAPVVNRGGGAGASGLIGMLGQMLGKQ
jgi:hypothetical protein